MKLMLLPGMDGTGKLFSALIAKLGGDIDPVVVCYPERETLSYQQLQRQVEQALPQEDYILLGESFSGPIAIAIAAKCPPGLQGVILCASFASNPRPLLARVACKVSPSLASRPLENLLMWGTLATPEGLPPLRQILSSVPDEVLKFRIREVVSCDVEGELKNLDVPLLYLRAVQDHLVPSRVGGELVRRVNSAELVDIDGPHMLLQCKPGEASLAIHAFMQRLKPDTGCL